MKDIENKVIAITGASSGIGRATALRLAGAGAKLMLGARREEQLRAVAKEISSTGGEARICRTDVRDRASVQALVDQTCSAYGRMDVLVSNAGVGPISRLDDLRVEDWEAMIDINFRGVLYGIAAALPVFRRQESGHFVTVVSTAGLRIVPTQSVYAATKNAVRTVLEGLRQEAGPHLRVTGISPGYIRTDFAKDAPLDEAARAMADKAMAEMAIDPDAVARAIAFAIEQPADVDVGDIVIRPTAQA